MTSEIEQLRAEIAELRKEAALDTQILEKADRDWDEGVETARAFRKLAEKTQAWGEQHRARASRYRERIHAVQKLHSPEDGVGSGCLHCGHTWPCPTIEAMNDAVTYPWETCNE